MTDTEIKTMSTLFMLLICAVVISGTVGWWVFLQTFKIVDDYLQDRQFRKKGWKKMKDDSGQTWYVGYNE